MSAVLSIGSNLGDRLAHLRLAVEVLQPTAVSPVYETAPVGGVAQDDYLNAVVLCDLDAEQAWERAQEAERLAGRERSLRWGPRTLDVDLLVYGSLVAADPPGAGDPPLEVPHPRAAGRGFVLRPWADLAPDDVLPGAGRVGDLAAALEEGT